MTKSQNWGSLEQQNLVSEFWTLEVQDQGVCRAHVLSDGSRGESVLASSSFWYLLAILGIPWLVDASLLSHDCLLPKGLYIIFPLCMSVSIYKFPSKHCFLLHYTNFSKLYGHFHLVKNIYIYFKHLY